MDAENTLNEWQWKETPTLMFNTLAWIKPSPMVLRIVTIIVVVMMQWFLTLATDNNCGGALKANKQKWFQHLSQKIELKPRRVGPRN